MKRELVTKAGALMLAPLVPLILGGAFAGCSNSSGGGAPAAATVAGSTSASGSGSAASNPIPPAPASLGTPLATFNEELQLVWDDLRPQVLPQLSQLLATQLQGKRYASSAVEVEVQNVALGANTDMATAPGLLRLDTQGIVLRAPVQGRWRLELEADLRVQLNVGSLSPAVSLPVTMTLEGLWVEVAADLDDSDPTRPVLRRIGQPQLDFTLKLDSQNPLVAQLTGVLSRPADWIAQQAVALAINSLLPQLGSVQGIPGAIPVDGAAYLSDSGRATPFEEVAQNVSLKARQVNMPHGPVLSAFMDTPQTDTWLEGYRRGGIGNLGSVVDYEAGGDSAIWTGHTLAAEAFRYGVTGESLALDSVGHLLKGVGALLDVNGGSGLLARNAAPERSLAGQAIVRAGVFRRAQLFGETWVGRQGSNGISRDQYSGVMFGLSMAYEHVPQVRAECAYRIQMILDYLIANDWIVDEDRSAWNGATGSRGPTFWLGVNYQKLAFLLIGHRVDPARYGSELARWGALSGTAWLGMWTSTMGTDHYYKFNLVHVGLYNYFRLETDPQRWQDLRRGYAMLERYVGRHRNPHFDLIQTSIDPAAKAVKFPSIREAIRQFLDQPHREVAPAVIDLSGVQWVNLPQFGYSNQAGGGFSLQQTTQAFPTEPLDVHLRRPSGHFQWQRDPFSPATPNQGNPRLEKVGLDLLLPYWMGRHLGAF